MRKQTCPVDVEQDDVRPEYDLASMSGGVRGKYYRAYRAGHTVKVHRADGTTAVQYFEPEEVIVLAPDVQEYFPNSEAVNKALRGLIALIPQKEVG